MNICYAGFDFIKNVVLCCRFNFYDGPPFATGLPHYGHILAGTIKDIVTRFAHQSGFHVDRRFGWDCHGLPVVCIINLPTDAAPCLSITFVLLSCLALLLKEKWKFFVRCAALAFVCMVIQVLPTGHLPFSRHTVHYYKHGFIWYVFQSLFFFYFGSKEKSYQDFPLKYLLSSGVIIIK